MPLTGCANIEFADHGPVVVVQGQELRLRIDHPQDVAAEGEVERDDAAGLQGGHDLIGAGLGIGVIGVVEQPVVARGQPDEAKNGKRTPAPIAWFSWW